MALVVNNLDHIIKADPRLGEALLRVQTFTNENVKPATGNRPAPPPTTLTNFRTSW